MENIYKSGKILIIYYIYIEEKKEINYYGII